MANRRSMTSRGVMQTVLVVFILTPSIPNTSRAKRHVVMNLEIAGAHATHVLTHRVSAHNASLRERERKALYGWVREHPELITDPRKAARTLKLKTGIRSVRAWLREEFPYEWVERILANHVEKNVMQPTNIDAAIQVLRKLGIPDPIPTPDGSTPLQNVAADTLAKLTQRQAANQVQPELPQQPKKSLLVIKKRAPAKIDPYNEVVLAVRLLADENTSLQNEAEDVRNQLRLQRLQGKILFVVPKTKKIRDILRQLYPVVWIKPIVSDQTRRNKEALTDPNYLFEYCRAKGIPDPVPIPSVPKSTSSRPLRELIDEVKREVELEFERSGK